MPRESRSFVVQLDLQASSSGEDRLVGRVENLGSGEWTRFRSGRALLRFLRDSLANESDGEDGK